MVQEKTSKAKKDIVFDYKGPPAYLTNPNRTDPFADPNKVIHSEDGTNQPIDWGHYTPSTGINRPLRAATDKKTAMRTTPASVLQRDLISISVPTFHRHSTASANTEFSTNIFTDKEMSIERWTSETSPEDELLNNLNDKANKDDEALDLVQEISPALHNCQNNGDKGKVREIITKLNSTVEASHPPYVLPHHIITRKPTSPPNVSDTIHDRAQFPSFEDQLDFKAEQQVIRANLARQEHLFKMSLVNGLLQRHSSESDAISTSFERGSLADLPPPMMNNMTMPPYSPHSVVVEKPQGQAWEHTTRYLEGKAEQTAQKEKTRQEERNTVFNKGKEARRVRDQKEMFIGLANSKKLQRGWNGAREDVRQEAIPWNLLNQNRQSEGQQQNEASNADSSAPGEKRSGITISELTNASEELRNRREVERLLLEDEAQNATEAAREHMMAAKWDADTIRESAIIERGLKDARIAERNSRRTARIRRHQGRSNLTLQGSSQPATDTQTSRAPAQFLISSEISDRTISPSRSLNKNKICGGAMSPTQSLTSDEISSRALSLFQTLINKRTSSTTSPSGRSLENNATWISSGPKSLEPSAISRSSSKFSRHRQS